MSVTIFSNCTKRSILFPWTCDKHHTHKNHYKTILIPNNYLKHKTAESWRASTVVLVYWSCGKKTLGLIGTKVPDISPFLSIHAWPLHHFWSVSTSLYCLLIVKITTNIQVKISRLEQMWTASNRETSFQGLSKPITQIISIVILWPYTTS